MGVERAAGTGSAGLRRRDVMGLGAATVGAIVAGGVGAAAAAPAATHVVSSATGRSTADGARRLAGRILGAAATQVTITVSDTGGPDEFTISGTSGAVQIAATSTLAACAGLGWYLKYVAHASVNLGNMRPRLSMPLVAPAAPIRRFAHEEHRYAFNDTHEGYTDPNMSAPTWQSWVDMLALHGVSAALLTVGTDAVYQRLFTAYGYSMQEMREWIPLPAHQPWWLLQNMFGSDDGPMSQALIQSRAALGRQVADAMRAVGITPVLPGYFGTVPTDFGTRNSGASVVPQGNWVGYQRPGWLDPTTPLFARVAADYYRISAEILGPSDMYKMDPLHEGGQAGSVNVTAAATAIEAALRAANPGATWALLGWQRNPAKALLAGIADKSRLLIVDGLSDRYRSWDREADWGGAPYAFGSIYDFGGHSAMGANMSVWLERYFAARTKAGSALKGVAIMPEGFATNPAAFELLAELPWHDAAPDLSRWMSDYAFGRYGVESASDAWQTLAATAYRMPADGWSEPADSLSAAQPALDATTAAAWSPNGQRYDTTLFAQALPAMIAVGRGVPQQSAFDYDLADITRQVLTNSLRDLLPELSAAHQDGDAERFDAAAARWHERLALLDEAAGTRAEFRLGASLAHARSAAITSADGDRLQRDLCRSVTVWGGRGGFNNGLGDYANRDWHGLIGTYYAPRWRRYLDGLSAQLHGGPAPAGIDWWQVGQDWVGSDHAGLSGTPSGDIHTIAPRVVAALN